jgi:uncharacterized coiled-coil protein SlyX
MTMVVARSSLTVLVCAAALLSGCRGRSNSRPDPRPDTTRTQVRDPELEARVARLELQVLEREGQIDALQAQLEDARQEVVRAMAKLQTLATRAEAASGMSEAEIAVQSLRGSGGREVSAELTQAGRLLSMSTSEFNQENYGGALYLATQARSVALAARGRLASVDPSTQRQGEVLFAVPLRLQANGQTNVRQGPGRNFSVAYTVERGTALVGVSYVGQWVRVTDDTGRSGWIFQGLLARRGGTNQP